MSDPNVDYRMIEILLGYISDAKKKAIDQIQSEFPSEKMIDILQQVHCSLCQEIGRLESLMTKAGVKDSPDMIVLLRNAAISAGANIPLSNKA